jgi:hypothetical protein
MANLEEDKIEPDPHVEKKDSFDEQVLIEQAELEEQRL